MSAPLRPRYKQTEIGSIPQDWEVVDLADIAQKITDGEHVTPQRTYQGYYLLSARNVLNGKIDVTDVDYVGVDEFRRIKQRCNPETGDVLISCSGTIGRVAVVPTDFECVLVRSAALVKLKKNKADAHFVQHWLQARVAQLQISTSVNQGAQPNLFLNHIERLKCPKLPLVEQEAIAEALSDADALIESLEQLVAKKRHLKQGTMQELLTPKNGWGVEKLEAIADVIDPHPSHRAPPEVPNGIPFVGIGDLDEDGNIVSTRMRTVAAPIFDEHRARYKIEDGLIGLGRVASIGKVVKLKEVGVPFAISPTLGVIRGTKVSQDYLFQALKSRYIVDQFARIMSGSTRSSVGMVVLRQLEVPIPRIEAEQTAISTTLADMDVEIAELEIQLAKTRALKQGMMHKLLTGEIRLI